MKRTRPLYLWRRRQAPRDVELPTACRRGLATSRRSRRKDERTPLAILDSPKAAQPLRRLAQLQVQVVAKMETEMREAMIERAAEHIDRKGFAAVRRAGTPTSATTITMVDPNLHHTLLLDIRGLLSVPLGFLRKDAARTVAVCRYSVTSRGLAAKVERARESGLGQGLPLGFVPDVVPQRDVREIAVHKALLDPELGAIESEGEWDPYCRFLLYHENLHALGFFRHGAAFRALEGLWREGGGLLGGRGGEAGGGEGEGKLEAWLGDHNRDRGDEVAELLEPTSPPPPPPPGGAGGGTLFAQRLGPGRWLWECRGRCRGPHGHASPAVYVRWKRASRRRKPSRCHVCGGRVKDRGRAPGSV